MDPNVIVNLVLGLPPIGRAGFGIPLILKAGLFTGGDRVRAYSSFAEAQEDETDLGADVLGALSYAFAQSPRTQQIKVGAIDTSGGSPETALEALTAIAEDDPDFYSFTLLVPDDSDPELAADGVIDFALFAAQTDRFAFVSIHPDVAFDDGSLDSFIEALSTENIESAALFVHQEPGFALGVMSRYFSTDPDQRSAPLSNLQLALTGPTEGLTTGLENELVAANINFVRRSANTFNLVREGVALDGRPAFFRVTLNWFSARLREDFVELLAAYTNRNEKLPLNDAGIAAVRQVIDNRIAQGEAAGHFEPNSRVTLPRSAGVLPQDRAAGLVRGEVLVQIQQAVVKINITGALDPQPVTEG